MYNSNSQNKCPYEFVQEYPRFICRYAARYREISELKGFQVKCRDPRCSESCNLNWACKHGTCVAKHLRNLPPELKRYRGNLTLPAGATVEDHRRIKSVFLQALRRWKAREGYTLEIHAVAHPTSPREVHYDVTAYSDGPAKPVRQAVKSLWIRSGGKGGSFVALDDDEIDPAARYQAKDTPLQVNREKRYLLAPRSIEITWQTGGFWRGDSLDAIWSRLIAEWFDLDDDCGIAPIVDRKLSVSESVPTYTPGVCPERDKIHFRAKLPTDPRDAIGISNYAKQWGVTGVYMLGILRGCPNAICLDGWSNPDTGHLVYNAWHR